MRNIATRYGSKSLLIIGCVAAMPYTAYAAEKEDSDESLKSYELSDIIITAEADDEDEDIYAGGQIARKTNLGILGDRDYMDTPLHVQSYSEQYIEDKQAHTLNELLLNNASVQEVSGSSSNNLWSVRGMDFNGGDVSFNGLFNIAPYYANNIDAVERVDVIMGPSALLNGMPPSQSMGASINLVPKRAKDEQITRFTVSYGNGYQFGQKLDIGRRFGRDNMYGLRMNFSHRSGYTTFDNEHQETKAAALAFDVRHSKLTASLDAGYLERDFDRPTSPLRLDNYSTRSRLPAPLSGSMNLADENNYLHARDKYGLIRADYKFTDDWSAYLAAGMRHSTQDYVYNTFRITNNATGAARILNQYFPRENKADTQEIGIQGKFSSGDLRHDLTLAYNRTHWENFQRSGTLRAYYVTNYYNIQFRNIGGSYNRHLNKTAETTFTGFALTDIITVPNDRWQFILGARYQEVNSKGFNQNTGAQTSYYNSSTVSPALGIVFKATSAVSLYASYIQGLEPGRTVNDSEADNDGYTFSPQKTRQHEVGLKFDSGKFGGTLAVYEAKRPTIRWSAFSPVPAVNPIGTYEQVEYTNQGVELSFFGEPHNGTRLIGGFNWVHPEYYNGTRVAGIPGFNAVIGVEQDIRGVEGLSVSARLRYTSSAYYEDSTYAILFDPYFLTDIGARYEFKAGRTPMTLRFDVNNLFDKRYWKSGTSYRGVLGEGRNVMVSLTAEL